MIKIKDIEELRERLKRSEDLGIVRIRTMYCDGSEDICIKQNGYFLDLPDDFVCPDCGHPKTAFLPLDDDQADPSDPSGPAQGWSDRWEHG